MSRCRSRENLNRGVIAVTVRNGCTAKTSMEGWKTWLFSSAAFIVTASVWQNSWSRMKYQSLPIIGAHGALRKTPANAADQKALGLKSITGTKTGRMTIQPTTKRSAQRATVRTMGQRGENYFRGVVTSLPNFSKILGWHVEKQFRTAHPKCRKDSLQSCIAPANSEWLMGFPIGHTEL